MANNYQWAINSLSAYPEYQGQPNVVTSVSWVCSGTDGEHNAATYGTTDITFDPNEPFTPFENLTLDLVIGWVHSILGPEGVAKAQSDCDELIAAQKTVKEVSMPLPWN